MVHPVTITMNSLWFVVLCSNSGLYKQSHIDSVERWCIPNHTKLENDQVLAYFIIKMVLIHNPLYAPIRNKYITLFNLSLNPLVVLSIHCSHNFFWCYFSVRDNILLFSNTSSMFILSSSPLFLFLPAKLRNFEQLRRIFYKLLHKFYNI